MSLSVRSHDFFGLGPTHAAFRYVFLVDRARKDHDAHSGGGDEAMGRQIVASILGDHAYVFSVTLPGSIEHVAPIEIGDTLIQPDVSGDFYHGHTVTWRIPLSTLAEAKSLAFEVDFSAYGFFADAHSQPGGNPAF
jgi:hypothetical protein